MLAGRIGRRGAHREFRPESSALSPSHVSRIRAASTSAFLGFGRSGPLLIAVTARRSQQLVKGREGVNDQRLPPRLRDEQHAIARP
jgi:hypothetical protein